MTGVAAALIGSMKSSNNSIFPNGSFTTDPVTDWSFGSRRTDLFKSAPASFFVPFIGGGEYSPETNYFKPGILTVGQRYSLSLWIYPQSTIGDSPVVQLTCGANTVSTSRGMSSRSWQYIKIENVLCTTTPNLSLYISSNDVIYLDDISLVAGATAVP